MKRLLSETPLPCCFSICNSSQPQLQAGGQWEHTCCPDARARTTLVAFPTGIFSLHVLNKWQGEGCVPLLTATQGDGVWAALQVRSSDSHTSVWRLSWEWNFAGSSSIALSFIRQCVNITSKPNATHSLLNTLSPASQRQVFFHSGSCTYIWQLLTVYFLWPGKYSAYVLKIRRLIKGENIPVQDQSALPGTLALSHESMGWEEGTQGTPHHGSSLFYSPHQKCNRHLCALAPS